MRKNKMSETERELEIALEKLQKKHAELVWKVTLEPTSSTHSWLSDEQIKEIEDKCSAYKIIARDKLTGQQYKKWVYEDKDKYNKYSPNIIKKYSKVQWNGVELDLEHYKKSGAGWERLNDIEEE